MTPNPTPVPVTKRTGSGTVLAVFGGLALVVLGIVLNTFGQFAAIASDACVMAEDAACEQRLMWGVRISALPQVPLAVVAGAFALSRAGHGPTRAARPLLWGIAAMVGCFAAGMLWVTFAVNGRDGLL